MPDGVVVHTVVTVTGAVVGATKGTVVTGALVTGGALVGGVVVGVAVLTGAVVTVVCVPVELVAGGLDGFCAATRTVVGVDVPAAPWPLTVEPWPLVCVGGVEPVVGVVAGTVVTVVAAALAALATFAK